MERANITFDDFDATVDDLRTRFPKLSRDDLFILWFLRANLTDHEEKAADAIAGGSRDKGIDALLIDDGARSVFVIQGKFRQALEKTAEKRGDVIGLVEVAKRLTEPDNKAFAEFAGSTETLVAERLKQARDRVIKHQYKIWLYFVTLGKVSENIRQDVKSLLNSLPGDVEFQAVDAKRARVLMHDYLDGVAPPIPSLELEMEQRDLVTVNGIVR